MEQLFLDEIRIHIHIHIHVIDTEKQAGIAQKSLANKLFLLPFQGCSPSQNSLPEQALKCIFVLILILSFPNAPGEEGMDEFSIRNEKVKAAQSENGVAGISSRHNNKEKAEEDACERDDIHSARIASSLFLIGLVGVVPSAG